jgi:hypothetical protein
MRCTYCALVPAATAELFASVEVALIDSERYPHDDWEFPASAVP